MATTEERYRDPSLPAEVRAADLLARMTLGEKVAQLGSAWSFELVGRGSLDPARARGAAGAGHRARQPCRGRVERRPRRRPRPWATRSSGSSSRRRGSGIPAILHEETLHGVLAGGATVFQQSIGAAASFDPGARRGDGRDPAAADAADGRAPRAGARAGHGARPALGPDRGDLRRGPVPRDGAWASRTCRAIQGPSLADGVAATAKHMVGHGLAEGGMNQAPVHAGRRELDDEQLAPFEAAVREGRIASIMPAYCDVDGVPCHASGELLDDDPAAATGGSTGSSRPTTWRSRCCRPRTGSPATSGSRRRMALARAWTPSCRHVGLRRAAAGGARRRPGLRGRRSTRWWSACCGSSCGSGCSSGRMSSEPAADGDRGAPGRARPWRRGSSPGGRSCSPRTTGSCRWRRARRGSRSSGRSRTAPATSSATTGTCSTSRRSTRGGCATTRSGSRSRTPLEIPTSTARRRS